MTVAVIQSHTEDIEYFYGLPIKVFNCMAKISLVPRLLTESLGTGLGNENTWTIKQQWMFH